MSGWVKAYRSLTEHWLWQDKPFSKGQAWLDLLFLVNHRSKKSLIDGRLQEIERGQTVTSVRKLCDRWGWSNTKVHRFLKMLESDGMVNVKSDSKKTVINVVNYSVYQDSESEKTTQKRQSNVTETSQKHTNKNEKKDKNEKNNIMCNAEANALFERLWKAYPNKRGKGQVSEAKKRKIAEIGEEHMQRAMTRYIEDLKQDDWRKPQNGSTFFNSGYVDYLDENYEKPESADKKKSDHFHGFQQRDYDMDDLERRLLKKQLGDEYRE